MHRSGTSAVAGCLQKLGVDFGPRLMPPTADNARGFFEHIDIVNLHDRLLLSAGSNWDDTETRQADWLDEARTARFREDLRELLRRDFSSAPLWGLKDPRLCRLLPWWRPLWAELNTRPLYLIVLRDPREVAASLARRDGFSLRKAYLLWLQHILDAERETRYAERVFVDFADFLNDWRRTLEPVGALLGGAWPIEAVLGQGEAGFVDIALPRKRLAVQGGMPAWVEEVDAAVRIERKRGSELPGVLDAVARQLDIAQNLYPSTRERDDDLAREFAALQKQAIWYEEEWQKARRRLEEARQQLEKRREEVISLKNRILALDRVVSNVRMVDVSYVRKERGFWLALFSRFRPR